jgi:hypothetical protein
MTEQYFQSLYELLIIKDRGSSNTSSDTSREDGRTAAATEL